MKKDIAIVIPCYNRAKTLNTLLNSLKKAKYDRQVELVFSIDYSGNDAVFNVANAFEWPFGKKTIFKHKENVGLRQNILGCGDMTAEHDAVIVLEDDLVVSPDFFIFASEACDFYWNDDRIAGVSLYNYRYSETHHDFYPISGCYDAYFMQWTSSWGQLWTKAQWKLFKEWYADNDGELKAFPIPDNVKQWWKSWKKYHIAYLSDTNRYFVYPVVSFTTMIPSEGTHSVNASYVSSFFMPLGNVPKIGLSLPNFEDVVVKYDSFFEPREMKVFFNGQIVLADCDFFKDKKETDLKYDYFITSKRLDEKEPLLAWGKQLIPHEENILRGVSGEEFFLYSRQSFMQQKLSADEKKDLGMELSLNERLERAINYFESRLLESVKWKKRKAK